MIEESKGEVLEMLDPSELVPLDEPPPPQALVILEIGPPVQRVLMETDGMIIGRGSDAALPIDHPTVSRFHARIDVTGEGAVLEDLASENGTHVNGERIERRRLEPGDHILLGRVEMVYLGEVPEIHQWEGTPFLSLPEYKRYTPRSRNDSTFHLSKSLLARMQEVRLLLHQSTVVEEEGDGVWKPGHAILVFGEGQPIPASARFCSGPMARLDWDGRHHTIHKSGGRFCKVTVNGTTVNDQALKPGDKFTVGRTGFRYELP